MARLFNTVDTIIIQITSKVYCTIYGFPAGFGTTHPVDEPTLPLPLWCPLWITLATVTRHSIVSPARKTDRRGSFAVISIISTLRNRQWQTQQNYVGVKARLPYRINKCAALMLIQ